MPKVHKDGESCLICSNALYVVRWTQVLRNASKYVTFSMKVVKTSQWRNMHENMSISVPKGECLLHVQTCLQYVNSTKKHASKLWISVNMWNKRPPNMWIDARAMLLKIMPLKMQTGLAFSGSNRVQSYLFSHVMPVFFSFLHLVRIPEAKTESPGQGISQLEDLIHHEDAMSKFW